MKNKKYSYDHNFKALFSNPRMLRELLEFINPELAEELDWKGIKPPDKEKTFLTDDSKEFRQDLIAEVPLYNQKQNGNCTVFLILLIEFQSRPERFMSLRVLNYLTLFWLDWLKNRKRKAKLLPPVFPIVFYNGKRKWNYPANIKELIYSLEGSSQFYPDFKFYPFYLNQINIDHIKKRRNGLSAVLQIEKAISYPDFLKALTESGISLDNENKEVVRLIRLWFSHLVKGGRITAEELAKMDKTENREEDEAMITEVLNEYYEETIQKGIAQGKAEGEQKAKRETARNLLKAGVSPEIVIKATGLTSEEVAKLQEK